MIRWGAGSVHSFVLKKEHINAELIQGHVDSIRYLPPLRSFCQVWLAFYRSGFSLCHFLSRVSRCKFLTNILLEVPLLQPADAFIPIEQHNFESTPAFSNACGIGICKRLRPQYLYFVF